MNTLIVDCPDILGLVGGAQIAGEHVNILKMHAKIFVAADSGADHLLGYGITPSAVIGDFDSVSPAARETYAPYLVHVAEQDSTDLEKALHRITAPVILGAGFLGGRLDHSFASLSVLARYRDVPLILLSAENCCFRAPEGPWDIALPVGTDFAVLPMSETVVRSEGLQWDMDQIRLSPVGMVSSSNKTAASVVRLEIQGDALITLPLDHLPAAIGVVRAG